ncbi:thioredoxin domain-containing protein [Georgenia sp. EYE_87]|uniref:thioredoxin domain-containing protein n=1 Tax=Georgenia sp. EYE_87 TaxID=2853448 RepID=UPI00200402EE|nr:thioredoxin domain-containing protein [Georgenia sp. EYE_87]MCK6211189.1 thioredoxin domain-containing protein [Georgenia sp. EYE_87]
MSNRLAGATSPYLLQHADNPVHWQEWGEAAFAEARRRDVPVLLSIGYAACHWCHVMAHESFEDPDVAAVLNSGFVAVKVDREERPDIDAVYMTATTAMSGQGGWPMTCFLTPDGEPFFCGTYYPRAQFLQLLGAVREAWTTRRAQVDATGANVARALAQMTRAATPDALDAEALDDAVAALARDFDEANGGFGDAPKFPPSSVLEFLLRHHARTGDADALRMVEATCEAMARGGMYDQLAGGFARYSVDARWIVPHFEKMLYDNAQLLRDYLHLHRATGSSLAERVARETADFLLRDLRTAEGAFASSLDADADGVEGLTYAWTPRQLAEVLGPDDGARAAALLAVTELGTFEHGSSTLQLRRDPDDPAWWADARRRLLVARDRRPQPARDDKVVTSWNGLTIAALAEAGVLMAEPGYLDAARECAAHVLGAHLVDGRLRRASRDGAVGAAAGVADDHGNLAEGLLALHQATGEVRWLEAAGELLEIGLAHFADGAGGFFDVADDAERLVTRPRDPSDNVEPSGQSSLAGALLTYSALTGSSRHREAAEGALAAAGAVARSAPRFAGWSLAVAEAAAAGPLQVAVVGDDDAARELAAVARASTSPGLVVAVGAPDAPGVPLLADRPLVRGGAAAYVCRGFVCDLPVTTAEDLAAQLGGAVRQGSA